MNPTQKRRKTAILPSRRAFNKLALAGALGGPLLLASPRRAEVPKIKPRIKLCVQSSATPSDEELLFIKQLPVIAISEVKEIIPPRLRRAHPHANHIDAAARHLDYEPDTPGETA